MLSRYVLETATPVDLARLEFAVTASVHFLFVLLTLGLVTLVAIMQTRYARTGEHGPARRRAQRHRPGHGAARRTRRRGALPARTRVDPGPGRGAHGGRGGGPGGRRLRVLPAGRGRVPD